MVWLSGFGGYMPFSIDDIIVLQRIHQEVSLINQSKFSEMSYTLDDYWNLSEEDPLRPRSLDLSNHSELFSLRFLTALRQRGFNVRLVYLQYGNRFGHCVCEVSSEDGTETYFFDHRYNMMVTREQYRQSFSFISCSVWNPVIGDKRKWLLYNA